MKKGLIQFELNRKGRQKDDGMMNQPMELTPDQTKFFMGPVEKIVNSAANAYPDVKIETGKIDQMRIKFTLNAQDVIDTVAELNKILTGVFENRPPATKSEHESKEQLEGLLDKALPFRTRTDDPIREVLHALNDFYSKKLDVIKLTQANPRNYEDNLLELMKMDFGLEIKDQEDPIFEKIKANLQNLRGIHEALSANGLAQLKEASELKGPFYEDDEEDGSDVDSDLERNAHAIKAEILRRKVNKGKDYSKFTQEELLKLLKEKDLEISIIRKKEASYQNTIYLISQELQKLKTLKYFNENGKPLHFESESIGNYCTSMSLLY